MTRPLKTLRALVCVSTLLIGQPAWPADTRSCIPVAKLVLPEGAQAAKVRVELGGRSGSPPGRLVTELCGGDTVSWPKGVTVGILYYQSPPKYVEDRGDKSVTIIDIPKNTMPDNIWRAAQRWLIPDSVASVRVGATRSARSLTSPLARGENKESPFYLLTDVSRVHFFWHGGQAPWTLQIRDPGGRVIVDESVSVREAAFNLPDRRDGGRYLLVVSSADGRSLQKPLVLESPARHQISDASDPWTKILQLLAQDDEKNWRLYLWNAVRELPDGPAKTSIMTHLEADDL